MRILHITGQKPNSTGSGVYMSGLVNNLKKLGHEQGVIAGIDIKDSKECFSQDIKFYPVIFNDSNLPFSVVGMSDIMPYESTRYKDLTEDMIIMLKKQFLSTLYKAINEFKPEIIICNHLYLITAFVREAITDIKVFGICHGTCLRQLSNIDLRKEYIISNIQKLDKILVLHEEQRKMVKQLFKIDEKKIIVVGSGYDDSIFYNKNIKKNKKSINITYAGKICKSKGIKSLLLSLNQLSYDKDLVTLNVAGSSSNKEELKEILQLADNCKYKINFLGRLNHNDLSQLFNKSDLFILPSFYEGLPVVVLEALACGCKVIVSDINGVKNWMGKEINESECISYVQLPRMKSAGNPVKSDLTFFEDELSCKIRENIDNMLSNNKRKELDMKDKTWYGLSKRVDKLIKQI